MEHQNSEHNTNQEHIGHKKKSLLKNTWQISTIVNAPATECSKQLSSASPSPGFGTASSLSSGGSAPSSAGGCASA